MKYYRYYHLTSQTVFPPSVSAKLGLEVFEVVRETPCGVWLKDGHLSEKWVQKESAKGFAQSTETAALENYVRRTYYRKSLLDVQLKGCLEGLKKANQILKDYES